MRTLFDREVLFFGGKGGVGKTTCAAAAALAASRQGKRVLLVSTDPAHSTSDIFERAIGSEPTPLEPSLHAMEIDAATESKRYVTAVKEQIATLFGHTILKEANRQIDLAATMPGVEEVALFDRMGAHSRRRPAVRFDSVRHGAHRTHAAPHPNARADGVVDPCLVTFTPGDAGR